MAKVDYLLRSIVRQGDAVRRRCPNCGSAASELVDRKMIVTALRRCDSCKMMFRSPTDDPAEASDFYNHEYAQGFTTEMPSTAVLDELKARSFAGTEKDYSYYIDVVRQLGGEPGQKLFDFGCSWGYGSYQFSQAKFETLSYEISVPRRRYGIENLGVHAVEDFETWAATPEVAHSLDIFFSAHVLEHVPSPSRIINLARRVLKPGGLFVAFFPNGSGEFRSISPTWSKLWGEVHPNFLDEVFLREELKDSPRIFAVSPAAIDATVRDQLRMESPNEFKLGALDASEMLCAARFY